MLLHTIIVLLDWDLDRIYLLLFLFVVAKSFLYKKIKARKRIYVCKL